MAYKLTDAEFDKSRAEKQFQDWDSRALPEKFLERFLSKKDGSSAEIGLQAFLDLVKSHPNLSFCLRGNDYGNQNPLSGGKVCIYENNHAMFVLMPKSLQINPNYLRYCDDWQDKLNALIRDYDFNTGKEIVPVVSKTKKKDGTFNYSCSFSSKISTAYSKELLEDIENLYALMQEIFEKFFDDQCDQDQFLQWAKGTGDIPPSYEGKEKTKFLEKIRQQQLYTTLRAQENGYYFYDMEFQQKHQSMDDQRADKANGLSNKPDMQALRFQNNKPVAWVFVEVKCTKEAYVGGSGLGKHISSMQKYIAEDNRECLERRRREAFLLLHQYNKLGLCNLDLGWDAFKSLKTEILLVFTDDAIDCWRNDKKKPKKTTELTADALPGGLKPIFVQL